MSAKAFIDTNVVIYALGGEGMKATQAARLFAGQPTISTQVLTETANVALRKLALPLAEVRKLLSMLASTCRVEVITPSTIQRALDIVERYQFSWFDSLILAAALDAGCDALYTEDLQHGQVIEGVLTVVNPFSV